MRNILQQRHEIKNKQRIQLDRIEELSEPLLMGQAKKPKLGERNVPRNNGAAGLILRREAYPGLSEWALNAIQVSL